MNERTDEEEFVLSLKVVDKLSKESAELYKNGNPVAAKVIWEFLAIADQKLLVIYHDIMKENEE